MLQLEKSIHWKNLQQLALQYRDIHLRELFTREGNRFETCLLYTSDAADE